MSVLTIESTANTAKHITATITTSSPLHEHPNRDVDHHHDDYGFNQESHFAALPSGSIVCLDAEDHKPSPINPSQASLLRGRGQLHSADFNFEEEMGL